MMQYIKFNLKMIAIICLTILLSGFTGFMERVPPPKDVPKRTEDKNAGIVIPAFDTSPNDIIKQSYDFLSVLALDDIYYSISSSNYGLTPHKLTFYHKKNGFVIFQAYRIHIVFLESKKPQHMYAFSFHPFKKSKDKQEAIAIAETWVKFFDSLGWKRAKNEPAGRYGPTPKEFGWPYMIWEMDDLKLAIHLEKSFDSKYDSNIVPKYHVVICFSNPKAKDMDNDS